MAEMTREQMIASLRLALAHLENAITCDGVDLATEVLQGVLDSVPPAPRVFLANDRVPVGTVITSKDGGPFRVPDTYATDNLATVGVPFVEVLVPSPEEWQAAVDEAIAEREASAEQTQAPAPTVEDQQPPRGEAAYWLEGDDEIFTEVDRG